jgi:hypothetical protein
MAPALIVIILVPGDREDGKGYGDAEELIGQVAGGHSLDGNRQASMTEVKVKGEADGWQQRRN